MARTLISFTPAAILSRLDLIGEYSLSSMLAEVPTVDSSSLLKQLSLHLPRLETRQIYDKESVLREAERLAKRLQSLRAPFLNRIPCITQTSISLSDLHFCTVQDDIARSILDSFHYILSYREHSNHFGLRLKSSSEWPMVMVSLSQFDLKNVESALTKKNGQVASALVLSRVFAFPVAPRNCFSFLMAKVREWVAENHPEIEVLVTYVNPNVGFSGASYKADNWSLIGEEHGTRYLYLDDDYKTERFFYAHFHQPANLLLSSHGSRVSASKHELKPLKIFIRRVSDFEANKRNFHFERWSL
ncbi:MAG TPA: hypothetical protein VMZ30_12670 [Pyrinomonadaceae bacterium]|nr:hypothetical protein [Pyrinomonadaceae bacterium]